MSQNTKRLSNKFPIVLAWLPTILYCGLIFYLSSSTPPESVTGILPDKVLHFFEYGLLSTLCFFSLKRSGPGSDIKIKAVLAILFASLYGVSDEIHQYFVPGRESSIGDVIADFVGAGFFQIKHIFKKF